MKKIDYFIVLILTLAIVLSSFQSRDRDNKIKNALEVINKNQVTLAENQVLIESRMQNTDKEIQSIVDKQEQQDQTFKEYQQEVDRIRGNLNDFNSLWNQLFNYEQEQYVMRGR